MKYVVTCYSENNQSIDICDSFENKLDAYGCLCKNAQSTYKCGNKNFEGCELEVVDFELSFDGTTSLYYYDGVCDWVWEVIESIEELEEEGVGIDKQMRTKRCV